MKSVQLVCLDSSIHESLMADALYMKAMMSEDWKTVADLVHQRVGRTLSVEPLLVNVLEWGGYYAVDVETQEVVGSCGYKGPPSADGSVEIAYFTYPDFEGLGYATLMARKLIELVEKSEDVVSVVAHTLPVKNASTRILERMGMTFCGLITDPEDGEVWRWEKRVG